MLLTALIFFAILTVLVMAHEFGHFLVARIVGVKVEEFGFGLPPRLFGKKIKGTLWSVNLLPIGGFVKLAGEDPDEGDIQRATVKNKKTRLQYFWARKRGERAVILLAGVTMNLLLAIGITTFLLTQGVIEQVGYVHVEKVSPGSPAEAIGLMVNDRIDTVKMVENGKVIENKIVVPDDLIFFVKDHAGETITLSIIRDGQPMTLSVVPRKTPPEGEGPLGVAISDLEKRVYPPEKAPFLAVKITFVRAWQMMYSIGNLLFRLVTGGTVTSGEVAGPVGIAQVTGQAIKYGWEAVLEFTSVLSLNLALLNILPLPALDGGRLAFVVLDKLGRKARPDIERTIHQIGMVFLLGLILLITISDILRIVRG